MTEMMGRYALEKRLAIGGMAEVFLAKNREKPEPTPWVVVKRMLPQLTQSSEAVAMFLDEVRHGMVLDHPHIAKVLDAGQVGDAYYLAMEYVDGMDAGALLAGPRKTLLPIPLAVFIVARAAEALDYAHRANDPNTGAPLGLIHRDISPHNILLSRSGQVKLSDFGIAKSTNQLARTATGVIKGKLSYMAPEQLNEEAIDKRIDIYSLGMCLYEFLVGKRVFSGASDIDIIRRVSTETLPPPSSERTDVDANLDELVMRMLAKDPNDRPQSAREAGRAFGSWLYQSGQHPTREDLRRFLAGVLPKAVHEQLQDEVEGAATEVALPIKPLVKTPTSQAAAKAKESTTGGLQRTPPPALKRMKPKKASADKELVLYVEDEDANWDVAKLRLKQHYNLIRAKDDKEACAILQEKGAQLRAVLMDIQLKGSALDGVDLVHLLRGKAPPRGDVPDYAEKVPVLEIPIFYVTAYGAKYSESELRSSGADRIVAKPVDFTQLALALTSYHLRHMP